MSGEEAVLDRTTDEDVEVLAAIAARTAAGGGYPDEEAVRAMEETVSRLLGGALMLRDAVMATRNRVEITGRALEFLAGSLAREAERLFRLYHGRDPYGR